MCVRNLGGCPEIACCAACDVGFERDDALDKLRNEQQKVVLLKAVRSRLEDTLKTADVTLVRISKERDDARRERDGFRQELYDARTEVAKLKFDTGDVASAVDQLSRAKPLVPASTLSGAISYLLARRAERDETQEQLRKVRDLLKSCHVQIDQLHDLRAKEGRLDRETRRKLRAVLEALDKEVARATDEAKKYPRLTESKLDIELALCRARTTANLAALAHSLVDDPNAQWLLTCKDCGAPANKDGWKHEPNCKRDTQQPHITAERAWPAPGSLVTCDLWRHGTHDRVAHYRTPQCVNPKPAEPKEREPVVEVRTHDRFVCSCISIAPGTLGYWCKRCGLGCGVNGTCLHCGGSIEQGGPCKPKPAIEIRVVR